MDACAVTSGAASRPYGLIMRVAVSGKVLERNVGGNSTYARALYEGLSRFGVEAKVLRPPGHRLRGPLLGPARALSYAAADGLLWPRRTSGRARPGSEGVDLLHYPADTGALVSARVPVAATIHGVPPSRPTGVRRAMWDRAWRTRVGGLARIADAVITVSDFSAGEIHEVFGVPADRLHVIPHGIDTGRFHPDGRRDAEVLAPLGLPERYVLCLGSLDPRKNVPLLVSALTHPELARLRVPLVWAGVPCVGAERIERALAAAPHVRALGPVPARLVAPLLRSAAAFALPSSHEGFGLPVVEAMACGTPVVVSDRGALPEVAGGAARVAGELTQDGLARALREVLTDDVLAADLRARGFVNARRFTWERSARRHHEVFGELLG